MKLLYSQTSPFARKVLVLAHEAGLLERLTLEPVATLPTSPNATLAHAGNPLMKIPTLVLDDGTVLFDSPVVVEYLDSLTGGKFIPATGAPHWHALRTQALADGIIDAAILVRYELALRPADKQWQEWIDGQLMKVHQGLDALEADATLGNSLGIAEIAAACALGYLDFRFGEDNWRATHPRLSSFYQRFSARPSMQATKPA